MKTENTRTTVATPLGRKGTGAARREQILDVAKDVFVTEGFERATMRNIADRLGLSATALYFHFKDKDALLTAIANRTFEQLNARIDEAIASYPGGRLPLEVIADLYIDFGLEHPDEYRLTFMTPPAPCEMPEGEVLRYEEGERAFASLAECIAKLIADGTLKTALAPSVAATTVWAAMHGYVSLVITHPSKFDGVDCFADAGLVRDAVIRMIACGLNRPGPAG